MNNQIAADFAGDFTDLNQSTGVKQNARGGAEAGFSLIEVVVAMVIIMVALLGVVHSFTYAIVYNAGNDSRAQALAVLQQEVENLRSMKFIPTYTDPDLTGGQKPTRLVTAANGVTFTVDVTVDNDPAVAEIQTETDRPGTAVKEIEVTVRLASPNPGWQTAVPATVVMRRVRGN